MSQVHEKLQNIPEPSQIDASGATSSAAKPDLKVVGRVRRLAVSGMLSKLSAKQRKMLLPVGTVLSIVIFGGILLKRYIDSRPVEAPPKVEPVDPAVVVAGLLKQERYEDAIVQLEEVLKADPDNVGAIIDLALAKKKSTHIDEAKKLLTRAIELKPDDAVALNNLGCILAVELKWKEAIELYTKALAIRAEYSEAHFNAATAYEATQQWGLSISHYESFLSLDKQHVDMQSTVRTRLRRLRAFQTYFDSSQEKV